MKKKGKKPIQKNLIKTKKKKGKKKRDATVTKVIVGEDEFCPTCMEWRAYDEVTGKCTVCGRQIKKTSHRSHMITEEYDLKDFTVEHDDQQEQEEN